MTVHREVTVVLEMLDIQQAVWCDACALPSAAIATLVVTVGGRTTVQTRTICEGDHT